MKSASRNVCASALRRIKTGGRQPVSHAKRRGTKNVKETRGGRWQCEEEALRSDEDEPAPEPGTVLVLSEAAADRQHRTKKAAEPKIGRAATGFRLPFVGIAAHGRAQRESIEEDELKECARAIEQKCREFDVGGHVTQINPGPVVTTYEFKPEAGIKYSRITGLADDLCLALRAESILIERIAGKSTVGIEVPNQHRQTITLRETIESPEFVNSPSQADTFAG